MRAIVAGGSLGGLFAANLLHRAGWEVQVFERVTAPLAGRGAGIVTHPALIEALAAAGADTGALGVEVPGRVVIGADGVATHRMERRQVLTSWSRLHALLSEATPEGMVRRGRCVERFEEGGGRVAAHFAEGAPAEGDLLVGADGIRSTVRRQMLPEVAARYAGYVAWRGVVEEAALSPATHRAVFERFAFGLPDGEQFLGYPIAGDDDDTRPGRRRWNFVWYRPADTEVLRDLQTDVEGRHWPEGIPPPRLRPGLVAAMRADAGRLLGAPLAEMVARCPAPFVQPIMDLEVPRLVEGRVALLGDAAFVARPHVGMGVTKAAEDAVALAVALASGGGLPAYEAARLSAGAAVVARARALGAYMERVGERVAQAVMAETAWVAAD